jgi:hypothetical protein
MYKLDPFLILDQQVALPGGHCLSLLRILILRLLVGQILQFGRHRKYHVLEKAPNLTGPRIKFSIWRNEPFARDFPKTVSWV